MLLSPAGAPDRRGPAFVVSAVTISVSLLVLVRVLARPAQAAPGSHAPPITAASADLAPPVPAPSPPASATRAAAPLPPLSPQPVTVADELGRPIGVYPPVDGKPGAAMVVFLHATCMDPRPVCDTFGAAGRDRSFLVCPSGNATCYGAPDWHGPPADKAAFLTRSLGKIEQQWGPYVSHDDTLIGWSRGGFAARDILYDDVARGAPPRFSSLVILAADVTPDPDKLRAAGIRKVLMAAGDQDGSRITLQRAVTKLVAAKIPARYVSLGPTGHWWPSDFEQRIAAGLAWVREK
ncbi:MAG: hypothetical protein U0359_06175 [Byssovorax sp.]